MIRVRGLHLPLPPQQRKCAPAPQYGVLLPADVGLSAGAVSRHQRQRGLYPFVSKRPSHGLAPHRITSRLGYAYLRFNGSLGMVWLDDRPDGIYGRFRPEQTQFDLSLSWKLTRQVSIYIQGRNITNQPVKWMESPPGMVEGESPALRQFQEYGANWVLGCRGTF